jgi:glycosyltransferase involved in cell wall biosynthesis
VAVDARCLRRPGIGFYIVVTGILAELAQQGLSVALVTDEAAHASALRAQYADAEVVCLPKTTWVWWEQAQLARWLFRRRPDVWVAPTNYGVPLLRPHGTQCLLVVHDVIPLLFPRTYLAPRPLWAAMYLISIAVSVLSADQVVAVSDRTASDLRRFFRRRAEVVHPPVPERLGVARRSSPIERPYVVYSGGFDPRKNVPHMLEAFAAFRATAEGAGALLVVLGDREDLARSMLSERGLGTASIVTGFVSDDEKWDYLVSSLAVLYPSSYEGFGLVTAEAFAAGVPVVCGSGGALREVGGEGAIFVDPTSVESILQGLRSACDPVVRARAVEHGYLQLEVLRRRSGRYAQLLRAICAA